MRTLHGVTRRTDDYAWLKDANWQEVLRNPALLDPDIRAYLEAENRYTEAFLGPTAGAAEDAGRRDARPHQGGRFRRAAARRAVRLSLEVSRGRPARADRPHAARRRRRPDPARRRRAGQGPADYFEFGGTRHSPDHRLEAWSADLRGSEYFTIRVRRWQTGEDLPDVIEQTSGSVVWGRRFDVLLSTSGSTTTTGRCRSTAIAWARRRATTCWSTRSRTSAGSRVVEESASGRFCIIATGNQETSERWLIDLADADADAAPGRAARDRRALQRRTIAATSCSSSPTRATPSTSASPRRRWPRPTARTGAS